MRLTDLGCLGGAAERSTDGCTFGDVWGSVLNLLNTVSGVRHLSTQKENM